MGKRRRNQQQEEGGPRGRKYFHSDMIDSLHIKGAVNGNMIALAAGREVRVSVDGKALNLAAESMHTCFVRTLAFSPDGKLLASGADDKTFKLWDLSTGACRATVTLGKKVSAVGFTQDSKHVFYADKFGDVYVAKTEGPFPTNFDELSFLQGHFCSIITDLKVTPCGRLIMTTEKECKARVTWLPSDPLAGDGEIQAFCVGHTAYVAASDFVRVSDTGRTHLLVTASGDGTLRAWDYMTCALIDTLDLGKALGAPGGARIVAFSFAAVGQTIFGLALNSGGDEETTESAAGAEAAPGPAEPREASAPSSSAPGTRAFQVRATERGFEAASCSPVELEEGLPMAGSCFSSGGEVLVVGGTLDAEEGVARPYLRSYALGPDGRFGPSAGPAYAPELVAPTAKMLPKEVAAGISQIMSDLKKRHMEGERREWLEESKKNRRDIKAKQRLLGQAQQAGGSGVEGSGADDLDEDEEDGSGQGSDEDQ